MPTGIFVTPAQDLRIEIAPHRYACGACQKPYINHGHPRSGAIMMSTPTCDCATKKLEIPSPGTLLPKLFGIARSVLPGLISDPATPWQTLDVLYEDPHVERVWIQLGEDRLYLHRIHPCEKALFHPHPWPSAILILSGQYRMDVGYGWRSGGEPPVAASMYLQEGSGYEMVNPDGWHNVLPYGGPSLSLMLTAPPWPAPPLPSKEALQKNRPLTEEAKQAVLQDVGLALLRLPQL